MAIGLSFYAAANYGNGGMFSFAGNGRLCTPPYPGSQCPTTRWHYNCRSTNLDAGTNIGRYPNHRAIGYPFPN